LKTNIDIRSAARASYVPLWKIANEMGLSEPTFARRLRTELSESEKEKVFGAIDKLKAV